MTKLTKREGQVLALLANGYSIDEAAYWLRLSTSTVKNLISSAYKRLRVENRAQAFMELGWLTPPDMPEEP